MDINMKNVVLFKDGDWIKIKTGENYVDNKLVNVGTKLLVDDGNNYVLTNNIDPLERNFSNMSNDNKIIAAEDLMSTLSFATDIAEALEGSKAAKIAATVTVAGQKITTSVSY